MLVIGHYKNKIRNPLHVRAAIFRSLSGFCIESQVRLNASLNKVTPSSSFSCYLYVALVRGNIQMPSRKVFCTNKGLYVA